MKPVRRLILETEKPQEELVLNEVFAPKVRLFRGPNWRGLFVLSLKEIQRFTKISAQTILSPLIMTLLFYAVFALGMGGGGRMIGQIPFLTFILPGLVMMSMTQSAFMNTASSLILSKIQGNIVDLLMTPLSPLELTLGYVIGGLARGLVVGAVSCGALALITPISIYSYPAIAYYAIMGSTMLSLIGLLTGIWGDKFDHLGAIQNFIIMPATFLSGTFFSIQAMPEKWQIACSINPFFYMIDGFRYGFTGHADGALLGGAAMLLFINLALFNVAYWMFAKGTKLKP